MLNPPRPPAVLGVALGALLPDLVLGYIGPGMGLGALAVVAALALGVLLLLIGLVWYPLKRFRHGRTAEAAGASETDGVE